MNEATVVAQDTVSQAAGFHASDMYGDKVMMGLISGNYYHLSGAGGYIWDLLESPMTVNQLIERLTAEFEIEEADCREQVLTFLQILKREDMIIVADQVTHEQSSSPL